MGPVHIPLPEVSGRLFVWRAPRLVAPGRLSGADARSLEQLGLSGVVCLLEEPGPDGLAFSLADRRGAVESLGLELHGLPIPDFGVPALSALRDLTDALLGRLRQGQHLLVHCQAGLGRSGMVAAGVLVRAGWPPDEAIAWVRTHRPGAVETEAQEGIVHELAEVLGP